MKAIVYTNYGPPEVLKLQKVPKPLPGEYEVLIKNLATTVTARDWRFRKARPFLARFFTGLLKPKIRILGSDFSGKVSALGKNASLFNVGDHVYGSTNQDLGAYAQFICMPEKGLLVEKPEKVGIKEAAAVFFGGHAALHFLRKGGIRKGQKVVIYGASGAVGTSAVQLAHYFGAEVTGVCSSRNVRLVKSLGADRVIDYTKEDFTDLPDKFDIIFDTVGKSSYWACIRSLKKDGTFISTVLMTPKSLLNAMWTKLSSRKRVIGGEAKERGEDLVFLNDLLEAGQLRPVIDREFSLEQMTDAHRYVEKGHKTGNVIINIPH
ncbi:MAG: NAD(P)-dependent alcohol dehydrogenase [Eudoraea sp.]|nr:NAD(P)-dependent alcohol dehydrogenase [Eudoraea sp.]